MVIQGSIQGGLEGRTSKARDYFRGFRNQPAQGHGSVQGEMNGRLGRQECQSLVTYRCGKEEKETNMMSLKEKVGTLFPSGALSPSHEGISAHYREEVLHLNMGSSAIK